MNFVDPESLIANSIALLVLGWKTIYDLLWNPYKFKKDQKDGLEILKAAERKRNRTDRSTAITFLILSVSYAIFIYATIK